MKLTASTLDLGATLFAASCDKLHRRTDHLFAGLMIFQYFAGIALALVVSPQTWAGSQNQIHIHLWAAIILGGIITGLPVALSIVRPGRTLTRHSIAAGQALTGALLIHLSGGRIETHFHVFGSLAFLAFYRDWRVLVTASIIIATDHFVRGVYWPQSVFGVLSTSSWRWAEHAGWVVFEDIFLIYSCVVGKREMFEISSRQARETAHREIIEAEVAERTAELKAKNEQRIHLEKELEVARRLEAIGQLAAGVAHEINTPTQYVGDNTRFLNESFRDLVPLLVKAENLVESVRQGTGASELADELKSAFEEVDLEYLSNEIPRAIEQSLNGIDRVRKIVQSMREFSHPGVDGMTGIDLNRAIESTITVASNEWKYVAEIETDLDAELPAVCCLPGEINQVFLILIVNAAHAIADVVGDGGEGKGTITISTRRDGEFVEIRIADTGSGIPEAVQGKIFDPFFTTKEVGKGTGQGLSTAHGVVVQKHGGTLGFETEIGRGTTFIICLPLQGQDVEEPVS